MAGSVVEMTDMIDFDQGVIAEFRANGGTVGGHFEHMPMGLTAGCRVIPALPLVRN